MTPAKEPPVKPTAVETGGFGDPSGGALPGSDAPGPERGPTPAGEEPGVEAGPVAGPGSGKEPRRERGVALALLVLVVFLCLGWIGGTAISQLRRDLVALESRVIELDARARRSEMRQTLGALAKMRVDLASIRTTLPPDLEADLRQAETLVERVAHRIEPLP